MRKHIKWEEWHSPWEDELSKEYDKEKEYTDSYEEIEDELRNKDKPTPPPTPYLVGPIGVIPLNENNDPAKVFNFYMMHTNFTITKELKQIIQKIDGIETLDIYSRYRARVGFGKAFDDNEVINNVENILLKEETKPVVAPALDIKRSNLDRIKKHVKAKYKHWAIFVLADGQIDYITGETQDSVQDQLNKYTGNRTQTVTSWEVVNEAPKNRKEESNECGVQCSTSK